MAEISGIRGKIKGKSATLGVNAPIRKAVMWSGQKLAEPHTKGRVTLWTNINPAGAKRRDLVPRLRQCRAAGKSILTGFCGIGGKLRAGVWHKQEHAYSPVSWRVPSKAEGKAARASRASIRNSAS